MSKYFGAAVCTDGRAKEGSEKEEKGENRRCELMVREEKEWKEMAQFPSSWRVKHCSSADG